MHLHGQTFGGVSEKFSCTSSGFFWLKMQKTTFLKIFVVTVAGVVPCGIPKKSPVHRP